MRFSPRGLALLYLGFALPWMVWWAVWVPPIQGPDEGAHLARADQISHGGFIARRFAPGASGGQIDIGVIHAIGRFYMLPEHPERKADPGLYANVPWGVFGNWTFPNTAIYPPVYYLPASAAVFVARQAGVDVLHAAKLARLAQGFFCVSGAALVIGFAGPACLYLFTLLLLPSSMQLMTGVTQDGGMLVSAAAVGVLLARGGRTGLAVAAALLALIGACRPPYAALALLPLAMPGQARGRRLTACAFAILGAVGWILLTKRETYIPFPPTSGVDAGAQLDLAMRHPWFLLHVILRTLVQNFQNDLAPYFVSLVKMPGWYTFGALFVLLLSAWAAWRGGNALNPHGVAIWCCAALAATCGVFAIEYLTWTPVGHDTVWGVQGRYFLPIMATLPVCLARARRFAPSGVAATPLLFPVFSIGITLWRVVSLYR